MRPEPCRTSAAAAALVAALVLTACAPRGEITFDPAAAGVGTVERIIVATDRAPGDGPGQPLFTRERQYPPEYLIFDVSVPPDRDLGVVTFPSNHRPEPRFDFLTVDARELDGVPGFISAVNREIVADPASTGHGLLFVHGYNTNFAEGLYRQAQLYHDIGSHSVQVHYAWPSAAKLQEYLYDRESVLFSRDGLELTIGALARTNVTEFNLVAHSMGTLLLMDTLRSMSRLGYDEVFDKLHSVILLSPDIELDVFRRQAPPVVARGTPIIVVVSSRDRALAASALLRGERMRVGSVRTTEELGVPGVRVIDITRVSDPGFTDHFAIATSPEMLRFMRGLQGGALNSLNAVAGTVDTGVSLVQQGADLVLAPLGAAIP